MGRTQIQVQLNVDMLAAFILWRFLHTLSTVALRPAGRFVCAYNRHQRRLFRVVPRGSPRRGQRGFFHNLMAGRRLAAHSGGTLRDTADAEKIIRKTIDSKCIRCIMNDDIEN